MEDIQKWAEELLDDEKPLEVLYSVSPVDGEAVIIIKADKRVAVLKRNVPEAVIYAYMYGILPYEMDPKVV